MILAIHAITGAVVSANAENIAEAAFLGLVSHYLLDSIPHTDYELKQLENNSIKTSAREYLKIAADLLIGGLVILFFLMRRNFNGIALILTGAFFGLLPDGLSFLDCQIKNKDKNIFTKSLSAVNRFHKKMHSKSKNKKIALFSQFIFVALLIFLIFSL
jgi:hypothetical protein